MHVAFGEYQLDTERRTLQRDGRRIPVQSKAFDLLAYLIERRARVVSSDELLDALWPGLHVTPAALSTAVQKARQAVGDDGEHQTVLHTEHGKGFRFIAEVTDLSEPETAPPTPTRSRTRLTAAAGVAAVLLAAFVAWFLNQPAAEPAALGSVAVLPFTNISQDAAAEPFTNGIYDDIVTHISKIRDLKVIARTTMERLDPSLGIQEIGTKLGVAAVLEGGVQRVGDRVRINVQLNNCETEAHLWSETYDRELTAANIFAIQTEIAMSVADALRAELSPEEQDRIATVPTENLAAYQAYLLGNRRLAERTMTATVEAIEFFEQAIDLDPEFALAYVGLADGFLEQASGLSGLPTKEMIAKARAAANKALALDDQLGEAHAVLGYVRWYENDFAGAEVALQRAVTLSPNSPRVYVSYGDLLQDLGRFEEALALAKKAVELDPLSLEAILDVGAYLRQLGQFNESLGWYERALEIDPDYPETYWAIGHYHWFVTGRLDEAVVWLRKTLALDPSPWGFGVLGWILIELGDIDGSTYWISRAYEMVPASYLPIAAMQALALNRGDEAAARVYGEKAYEIWPSFLLALTFLRDGDVRLGRYAEARARYEEHYPELLNEEDPRVDRHNFRAAVDLALILDRTGDPERAELLRERSLELFRSMPRLGRGGYEIIDVQIHAQRGEKQKALAALRQAIDESWRVGWWRWFKHKPDLEPVYDEPEFQAMVAEIEADMSEQLARVREMERNGELEPIPEISAAAQ